MRYEETEDEGGNRYHIRRAAKQCRQLFFRYQNHMVDLVSKIICKSSHEGGIFEYIEREHFQTSFAK